MLSLIKPKENEQEKNAMKRNTWMLPALVWMALGVPGFGTRCMAAEQAVYWIMGDPNIDILNKEYMQAYKVKNTALAREKCIKQLAICPTYVHALYNLACAEAMLGHKEEAFVQLKKVVELRHGWDNTAHLKGDKDLASLHEDPRWAEIVKKAEENERVQNVFKEISAAYTGNNFALMMQKCDEYQKLDPLEDLTRYRIPALAMLGKKDEALGLIEKQVNGMARARGSMSHWLLSEKSFTDLKTDKRFQGLVAKAQAVEKSWGMR